MEKSALIREKINIQLDDVRKNPEGGFINQKKKKWKKRSHYKRITKHWQCRKSEFNQTMEERHNLYRR